LIIDNSSPSPDSNGYPVAWAGEWVRLSVGVRWCEEYEWIAGNSSWESWRAEELEGLKVKKLES